MSCHPVPKVQELFANANLLFIQNMRRAYAIRPYGIVVKNSLGGHFQTQILVYPPIPSILVQTARIVRLMSAFGIEADIPFISEQSRVYLYNMNLEKININLNGTLSGHQNPVFALAISSVDPNILFTGGNDKGVVEWDLQSMSFKRILCKVGSSVYSLFPIPGTSLLAIGMRSGQILIVDTESLSLKANLKVEQGAVFSIKTIPGKQELIAIGEEGYAYVWSLESYELLYRFKVSNTTVRVIEVDKKGSSVAFGDKSGEIHLFHADDFREVKKRKVHELPVTSLQFDPFGNLLSGGRDAKLFKLDSNLDTLQEIVPHMFTVYGIALNSEENLLATVSRDKTLKVWRLEDLALIKNVSRDRGYDSHYLSINNMLWDQDRIFTVSDDKTIKLWTVVPE